MLECNNCKEHYTNEDSGFSIFISENDVCEDAMDDGWITDYDNNKHYCPKCHTIDDDDNIVVKQINDKL